MISAKEKYAEEAAAVCLGFVDDMDLEKQGEAIWSAFAWMHMHGGEWELLLILRPCRGDFHA